MARLYKFIVLLFLVLFVLSAIYGILVAWGLFKIFLLTMPGPITIGPVPPSFFVKPGLLQGLVYSLLLLLLVIILMKRSINFQRQYTLREILLTVLYFFITNTVVIILYAFYFSGGWDARIHLLMSGPSFANPPLYWLPFPIAWSILYLILASRIKKLPLHGRQDRSILERGPEA